MRSFVRAALAALVAVALLAGPASAQELPRDVGHAAGAVVPASPDGFASENRGAVRWDYPVRARSEARALMHAYDEAWPRIREDLGDEVSETGLVVRIATGPEQMVELAPLDAPPPPYATGVAYPDVGLVIVSLTAPETWDRPDIETVLAHELSHVALERATAGQPLPRWFVEGVAIAQSGEHPALRARTLWEAVARDRLLPLSRLSAGFPDSAHGVSTAYAESASIVEWMRRTPSETAHFERVIGDLRRGLPFLAAVNDGYGAPLSELEHEWRRDLHERFSSLPLVIGGGVLWVLIFGLAVMAWFRRRRARRETLTRWAKEEAVQAQAREEVRARELRDVRERAAELSLAATAAMSAAAQQEREAGVPTVLHDGREHTLH